MKTKQTNPVGHLGLSGYLRVVPTPTTKKDLPIKATAKPPRGGNGRAEPATLRAKPKS